MKPVSCHTAKLPNDVDVTGHHVNRDWSLKYRFLTCCSSQRNQMWIYRNFSLHTWSTPCSINPENQRLFTHSLCSDDTAFFIEHVSTLHTACVAMTQLYWACQHTGKITRSTSCLPLAEKNFSGTQIFLEYDQSGTLWVTLWTLQMNLEPLSTG